MGNGIYKFFNIKNEFELDKVSKYDMDDAIVSLVFEV